MLDGTQAEETLQGTKKQYFKYKGEGNIISSTRGKCQAWETQRSSAWLAGKQREKRRFARDVKSKGKEVARLMATHPGDTKLNEITYRMHTHYRFFLLYPCAVKKTAVGRSL